MVGTHCLLVTSRVRQVSHVFDQVLILRFFLIFFLFLKKIAGFYDFTYNREPCMFYGENLPNFLKTFFASSILERLLVAFIFFQLWILVLYGLFVVGLLASGCCFYYFFLFYSGPILWAVKD